VFAREAKAVTVARRIAGLVAGREGAKPPSEKPAKVVPVIAAHVLLFAASTVARQVKIAKVVPAIAARVPLFAANTAVKRERIVILALLIAAIVAGKGAANLPSEKPVPTVPAIVVRVP